MDYRVLGKNIRTARKDAGLTIAKLAEKADLGDSHVGKIERAQGIPSLESLVKIANALGIGLDHLMNGDIAHQDDYFTQEIMQLSSRLSKDQRMFFLKLAVHNLKFFTESIGK